MDRDLIRRKRRTGNVLNFRLELSVVIATFFGNRKRVNTLRVLQVENAMRLGIPEAI